MSASKGPRWPIGERANAFPGANGCPDCTHPRRSHSYEGCKGYGATLNDPCPCRRTYMSLGPRGGK